MPFPVPIFAAPRRSNVKTNFSNIVNVNGLASIGGFFERNSDLTDLTNGAGPPRANL